jgi:DUF1365 family protein
VKEELSVNKHALKWFQTMNFVFRNQYYKMKIKNMNRNLSMTIVQKDHLRIRRNIFLGDAKNQRISTSILRMNLKKILIGPKKK